MRSKYGSLLRPALRICGVALLSIVASGPARAQTSLRLNAGGQVTLAPEYELVSAGEGMPTTGLVLGLGLDENFGVELGFHYAATRAQLFSLQSAGLRLLTLEVAASYFQPLWKALGVSARLGVVGDLARLQLQLSSEGERFRGWAAGFGFEGLAGVEIRSSLETRRLDGTRRGNGKEVRFTFEAGYRLRPMAMGFHHLRRQTGPEGEVPRIEPESFDAGTMRLSGVVIQGSAGISF